MSTTVPARDDLKTVRAKLHAFCSRVLEHILDDRIVCVVVVLSLVLLPFSILFTTIVVAFSEIPLGIKLVLVPMLALITLMLALSSVKDLTGDDQ